MPAQNQSNYNVDPETGVITFSTDETSGSSSTGHSQRAPSRSNPSVSTNYHEFSDMDKSTFYWGTILTSAFLYALLAFFMSISNADFGTSMSLAFTGSLTGAACSLIYNLFIKDYSYKHFLISIAIPVLLLFGSALIFLVLAIIFLLAFFS